MKKLILISCFLLVAVILGGCSEGAKIITWDTDRAIFESSLENGSVAPDIGVKF
jgi:hypothetical protein